MALSATRTATRPGIPADPNGRLRIRPRLQGCLARSRTGRQTVLSGEGRFARVGRGILHGIFPSGIHAAFAASIRTGYGVDVHTDRNIQANTPDRCGRMRAGYGTAGSCRKHARSRFSEVAAAFFAAALSSSGCISPHDSFVTDVDAAAWTLPAEIVYPNTDTLRRREMGLFLRCNGRFAEDTLTVRIAVLTPDSLRFEEPFTLVVPADNSPAAMMRVTEIPYRSRVRFACTGDYRIRITPTHPVRGVEAVGIALTPSVPAPQ